MPYSKLFIAALLFAAAALLASCGSAPEAQAPPPPSYRYGTDADMTADYLPAKDGSFSVLQPAGWQQTADEKNAPNIILWLLRDDYSASLSFTPMNMDPALYASVRSQGLSAVARVSLNLKKNKASEKVIVMHEVEEFSIGKSRFSAYEYSAGKGAPVIRVVLFDTGSRIVECSMLPATDDITPAENRRLFEIQQTVLVSMARR